MFQLTYSSDIVINDLPKWQECLWSDHDPTSGVKVGTSEDKLVCASSRSSSVATGHDGACGENNTGHASLQTVSASNLSLSNANKLTSTAQTMTVWLRDNWDP